MNEERKFLEKLALKNNGLLLIDSVLAEAQDEHCILHKHFEWDDTEAAGQYRREQARGLIQKCKIEIAASPEVSIRAFVSLQSDQNLGGGYRLTTHVLSDEDMRGQLLDEMRGTIGRWRQRLYLLDSVTASVVTHLEILLQRKPVEEETRV
jgi:hypothetical protein